MSLPSRKDRPAVQSTGDDSGRKQRTRAAQCYAVRLWEWEPCACPAAVWVRNNSKDVIYGVWKAKEEGLCGLKDFSLEE